MMGNYESYIVLPECWHVNRVFEIMVSTKKNEEAVSPVIGVILMVAVTVILAAIIAAFVFGMAGNIQSSKTIGLTLTQNATGGAVVTVQGGTSLPELSNMTYTLDGGAEVLFNPVPTYPLTAGKVVTNLASVTGKRMIIIGKFTDGSTQILLDKQF